MLSLARVSAGASLAARRSFSSAATKQHVGVVGLGVMGNHMANNLRKNGHSVVVCDVNPASTKLHADKGSIVAATPREVAELCGTIVTMLPSTAIVEHVYLGANGIHEALRNDHVLIDSSTIDPTFTKTLSDDLHARGAMFVDAPVSGGVVGAENGTLTFMVGGEAAEYEKVKPVLLGMGKNIVHCGASCTSFCCLFYVSLTTLCGSAGADSREELVLLTACVGNAVATGQVAKICNNLALAIQMTSVAEAMNLGVKLGIDPKVLMGYVRLLELPARVLWLQWGITTTSSSLTD